MTGEHHLGGRVVLHHGDSREVLKGMADCSVDSIVCDPPYALVSIVKRFGSDGAAAAQGGVYARASAGFMGKQWDTGETAFAAEFWAECLRVLKPGGHVLAFSGTRTYHRLACAIEDAGFEIRDQIQYLYGSGFPKSHSFDKAAKETICRCSASECYVRRLSYSDVSETIDPSDKRGEALLEGLSKSSTPPEERQQLPAAEVRRGQSGMEGRRNAQAPEGQLHGSSLREGDARDAANGESGRLRDGASLRNGADDRPNAEKARSGSSSRPQSVEQCAGESGIVAVQSQPQTGGAWPICERCLLPRVAPGLGTALKPACEPIVLARKPLCGTVAANVLEHGTGALNIDGCRVEAEKSTGWGGAPAGGNTWTAENCGLGQRQEARPAQGRWPANVIHDGSDEVLAAFPDSNGQQGAVGPEFANERAVYGKYGPRPVALPRNDSGSAARFFYSAKADAMDRVGSKHPTVKPVDLMRYLCRLVTPPGGTVLDPFAGSGTTGEAAYLEGFRCLLIEREAEYCDDIRARLALADAGTGTRKRAIAKKKAAPAVDAGGQVGLFE